MNKFMCIKELIKHIHDKSESVMKRTKYENDWFFYHDALSLMTAKTTITWMKEQGYYKRWVLPLGINKGTPFFGRPIGNSPEMMPMDSSLNKDVDDEVWYHVSLTTTLSEENPLKFSMSTPKRGASAYKRVWEQVPSSRRIIEDTNKFVIAINVISEHQGRAVAGLGTRNGHRNAETRTL